MKPPCLGLIRGRKSRSRLSKWELKTLSNGGRLTLLKSVLTAIPIYHMSLFKVPAGIIKNMESIRMNFFHGIDKSERKMVWIGLDNILASKKYGGLGILSFYAANRALLFKWVWRFLTQEPSLWSRFIKAIHGSKGGYYCGRKIGQPSLHFSFQRLPRGGIESEQYSDLSNAVSKVILPQMSDRWSWSLNSTGDFSVSSVCNFIDDAFLPKLDAPTRWVKEIPIKINILAWKINLDRLPTRANISARGLDIPSVL
ncbi:hypothetical protein Tco_0061705, partial [Tanacetum coccineum]